MKRNYDGSSHDFGDFCSDKLNFTRYDEMRVEGKMFGPQKALDTFDESLDWTAVVDSPVIHHLTDMIEQSKERDEYRLEDRE